MEQSSESVSKMLDHGRFQRAAYRDMGNGFPVVLVHGFPVDGSLWNYQARHLKADFRLLIPDLPGSGGSPLADPLSIEDMAEFLHDILVQEHIEQCIMIGHSMGGYVTLAFAEKYPEKLKGFGLFHSTAFADTGEKKQGRLRSIELIQHYGADVFLRQMIPTLFAKKYRKNKREQLNLLLGYLKGAEANALVSYYRAMMERPDRTKVLEQTQVPILFVIGKEDTAVPVQDVLQQASLPAVSEVHLFDEAAHMGMLELHDASTRVMEQFIRFCVDFPFVPDNRVV